jgi:hypothetical protein
MLRNELVRMSTEAVVANLQFQHYPWRTEKTVKLSRTSKINIFWYMMLCSLVYIITNVLNKISASIFRTEIEQELLFAAIFSVFFWLLVLLTILPWRRRQYVPPKSQLTSTRLHGIIYQEVVLFMFAGMRTSYPAINTRYNDASVMGSDRLMGLRASIWVKRAS